MTVTIFEEKVEKYQNVHIFTDNQAAIQAIEHSRRQSGQYIVKGILNIINRIQDAKPKGNIHLE